MELYCSKLTKLYILSLGSKVKLLYDLEFNTGRAELKRCRVHSNLTNRSDLSTVQSRGPNPSTDCKYLIITLLDSEPCNTAKYKYLLCRAVFSCLCMSTGRKYFNQYKYSPLNYTYTKGI